MNMPRRSYGWTIASFHLAHDDGRVLLYTRRFWPRLMGLLFLGAGLVFWGGTGYIVARYYWPISLDIVCTLPLIFAAILFGAVFARMGWIAVFRNVTYRVDGIVPEFHITSRTWPLSAHDTTYQAGDIECVEIDFALSELLSDTNNNSPEYALTLRRRQPDGKGRFLDQLEQASNRDHVLQMGQSIAERLQVPLRSVTDVPPEPIPNANAKTIDHR